MSLRHKALLDRFLPHTVLLELKSSRGINYNASDPCSMIVAVTLVPSLGWRLGGLPLFLLS